MNEELQNYVLSLTEQDAINAISNAKAQGRSVRCHFTKTQAWEAYSQAVGVMRKMLWIGPGAGMGTSCSVFEQRRRAGRPILSLDNLKFAFYPNKTRYQAGGYSHCMTSAGFGRSSGA